MFMSSITVDIVCTVNTCLLKGKCQCGYISESCTGRADTNGGPLLPQPQLNVGPKRQCCHNALGILQQKSSESLLKDHSHLSIVSIIGSMMHSDIQNFQFFSLFKSENNNKFKE